MTDEADLRELIAKQAIRESIYKYCKAVDAIDRGLGVSIWAPNATVNYGPIFEGLATEFIERVCNEHAGMEAHSHQIANVLIEFDPDAQTAHSESYVTATLRDARDGFRQDRTIRGRYQDQWVSKDGRWLITHRRFVHDLTTLTPAP